MSAANTFWSSNASAVAGENSESASVAHRSEPSSASRARTRRSAEPMKSEPPPADGAVPAVEFAWIATAGHERSPVASSNAATTTCAASVFRAIATTCPSETATGESTRPSVSSDHEIAPVSNETAYTVPSWSPTNAFAPSIVTPLREIDPRGVRQISLRSAREIATSVEPAPCSTGPVGAGVVEAPDGDAGRDARRWARRARRRSSCVVRTRSLEVDEDPAPWTGPDRRDRQRAAVPRHLPLDGARWPRRSRRPPRYRPRWPGRPRRRRPTALRPRGPGTSIGRGTGAAARRRAPRGDPGRLGTATRSAPPAPSQGWA